MPFIEGMATPLEPRAYSVLYEAEISWATLAENSRPKHFKAANEALIEAVEGSSELFNMINKAVPDFMNTIKPFETVKGVSAGKHVTWHHVPGTNKLELVWRYQHQQSKILPRNKAMWQEIFHPGNRGGFADGVQR